MSGLWQDVRHATRTLIRTPGFYDSGTAGPHIEHRRSHGDCFSGRCCNHSTAAVPRERTPRRRGHERKVNGRSDAGHFAVRPGARDENG